MLVTLLNNFHSSSARVRTGHALSKSAMRRLKKALCGVHGCTCSDETGIRGPQGPVEIEDFVRIDASGMGYRTVAVYNR